MGGMTGGSLPASIWRAVMSAALKDTPPTSFVDNQVPAALAAQPEEVTISLCDATGLLAVPGCPSTHTATFPRGQAPTVYCTVHDTTRSNPVPDVVGMFRSSARSTVARAGFSVSTVEQASNEADGTVVSQTPAGGTELASGASVTLYVSSGPPSQGAVPSVVGLSEAAARSRLRAAGFATSVIYVTGSPTGIVVDQNPSGGTRIPSGTTVAISVNR